MNNFFRTWSRKINRENDERKDERYGGQSEKFNVSVTGVLEGEKQMK